MLNNTPTGGGAITRIARARGGLIKRLITRARVQPPTLPQRCEHRIVVREQKVPCDRAGRRATCVRHLCVCFNLSTLGCGALRRSPTAPAVQDRLCQRTTNLSVTVSIIVRDTGSTSEFSVNMRRFSSHNSKAFAGPEPSKPSNQNLKYNNLRQIKSSTSF